MRSSNDGACTETCKEGDDFGRPIAELSRPACFSISPQTSHHTYYTPEGTVPRVPVCCKKLESSGPTL